MINLQDTSEPSRKLAFSAPRALRPISADKCSNPQGRPKAGGQNVTSHAGPAQRQRSPRLKRQSSRISGKLGACNEPGEERPIPAAKIPRDGLE